jgi:sterol desaturase/sphingolipid hydroxylase (fatty acid hydroxylase superfamily)
MPAIHFFARYLYVPTLLLGVNGLAVYLVLKGYSVSWLVLLLLAAIGLSFLMEHVLPYEQTWNQNHDDIEKDVTHGIVYQIANLITLFAFILISSKFLPEWNVWPRSLPILLQLLLAILVVDCTMTVIHYWSHRIGFLWRLHAIHHGVHRLYGFNGFVRHPLHQALDVLGGTLPLVLIGMPIPVAVMLGFTIALQLIMQHSNVDYALGPAQKFLAIGALHRLHHVNWTGEGDVNFGLFFTFWDWLLGTLRLQSGRKPSAGDIGIQDCQHFPQLYARQLAVPFDAADPCVKTSIEDHGRPIQPNGR